MIVNLSGKKREINSNVKYSFRSHGNIDLLFRCGSGHYYFVSFDGHKGRTFVNNNEVLNNLALYLNKSSSNPDELLPVIEDFLNQK